MVWLHNGASKTPLCRLIGVRNGETAQFCPDKKIGRRNMPDENDKDALLKSIIYLTSSSRYC